MAVGLVMLCCVALAPVSSAVAQGHLDRSFGKNGAVDLAPEVAKGKSLGAMALAPDGGILFT